jgi:hypothetical protein
MKKTKRQRAMIQVKAVLGKAQFQAKSGSDNGGLDQKRGGVKYVNRAMWDSRILATETESTLDRSS